MMLITRTHKEGKRVRGGHAGFALIELLVVVGILIIITSITLANYSRFGGDILLRNLAYDLALSVREAQVFGISARSFRSADFAAGHGVFTDIGSSNNTIYLYTDSNRDNFMTSIASEMVETITIGRGYTIDRICVSNAGAERCASTKLDILFKRPEPDAIIRAANRSGFQRYDRARIVVRSPRGNRLSILVEATGQISVQAYEE